MKTKLLTDTYIESLSVPKGKRVEVGDTKVRGLSVRVGGRKKSFLARVRVPTDVPGKTRTATLTLGDYPAMTVDAARMAFAEAYEARTEVLTADVAIRTYKDFIDTFVKDRLSLRSSEYSKADAAACLKKHTVDKFGTRPLRDVRTADLYKVIKDMVKEGHASRAAKLLGLLRQAYRWGRVVHKNVVRFNPVADMTMKGTFAKTENGDGRERYMGMEEIKKVWLHLETQQCALHVKNAAKIMLLTGVRTQELRLARWEHFNFAKGEWEIPKEIFKNRKAQVVPVTSYVRQLLDEMKAAALGSPWVCPSSKDQTQPMSKRCVGRAIDRAYENVDGLDVNDKATPHDMRRTISTHLKIAGVDALVCDKILGHTIKGKEGMSDVSPRYIKYQYFPERKAAHELWESLVLREVYGTPTVTQLRKAS